MTKYDKTVKELKEDIKELEKNFKNVTAGVDEVTKLKAKEVYDKTKATINSSIDKISAVFNEVKEDEKVDDLLDKVKAKAKEAVDYASDKIEAIANNTDGVDVDKLHDDIMAEFDKLKETEAFKKTKVLIKEGYDKINEFLEKPEVKNAIKKAKTTTIAVAKKGVDEIKRVIASVDEESNSKKKTTKKKVATKKVTPKKAATKKPAAKKATAKKAATKKTTK